MKRKIESQQSTNAGANPTLPPSNLQQFTITSYALKPAGDLGLAGLLRVGVTLQGGERGDICIDAASLSNFYKPPLAYLVVPGDASGRRCTEAVPLSRAKMPAGLSRLVLECMGQIVAAAVQPELFKNSLIDLLSKFGRAFVEAGAGLPEGVDIPSVHLSTAFSLLDDVAGIPRVLFELFGTGDEMKGLDDALAHLSSLTSALFDLQVFADPFLMTYGRTEQQLFMLYARTRLDNLRMQVCGVVELLQNAKNAVAEVYATPLA